MTTSTPDVVVEREAAVGALRLVVGSWAVALCHPRVVLTGWLCVTVPALLAVAPLASRLDDKLSRHPGATWLRDQALDSDFARQYPDQVVSLAGSTLAVALLFAWLAGGILTSVGTGTRFRYGRFLAEGARLLPKTGRLLAVLAVAGVLLTWGCEVFDRQVRSVWLYGSDSGASWLPGMTGPWWSIEALTDGLRWLYGGLFLALLLISKVALALLANGRRRSALLAFGQASWLCLRRPLRSLTILLLWAAGWMIVTHGIGMLTVHWLELRAEPWLGLLCGQVGLLWTQVMVVAALVCARSLAGPAVADTS